MKGLLRLLGLLPLRVHYALGRFVAWLAESVLHYRRDVVVHNLTKCFPDRNVWDLKPIRKEFYRHFGDLVAETVWFGGCRTPERLHRQRLVEIANPELLSHLYEVAPSVMILDSHYGNWELTGGIISYNYSDTPFPFTEKEVCAVYLRQSSPMWDAILRDNRCAPLEDSEHYPGYIESRDLIRHAYTHRDEKLVYIVNIDQRPYFASPGNIEVDFMGQRIQTMAGAAAMARKLGLAVVFQSMLPDRQGHYVWRYTTICEDASQMSVQDIMQQFYTLLELDVREQPGYYLWSHQRFARM